MKIESKTLLSFWFVVLLASLVVTLFLNKGMFFAFFMLLLLMASTFWLLKKYHKLTKSLAIVLCISFLLHFLIVIFIHYTGFRPVGGGADYEGYQVIASILANNFTSGNFSLEGLHYGHDFPVAIALLYIMFGSSPLVGLFFVVWLFILSVLFSYLIVLELSGTEKKAFVVGMFVSLYPSYAYFGSLLLKDTFIIPLSLISVWLLIRMIKKFSWLDFLIFFLFSVAIIYLRFYIGYALILSFIVSWFLSLKKPINDVFWLGVTLTFLLVCFAPFFGDQGYFGQKTFNEFLNAEKITQYREVSYNPEIEKPANNDPGIIGKANPDAIANPNLYSGTDSSFIVETGLEDGPIKFIGNSFISFIYALFGPFVWQLRFLRQYVSLVEVIPWYLYILFFIYSLISFLKKEGIKGLIEFTKKTAPLWSFAIFALGALALFINNYGIIARIRIPMIICLVIMMSLLFNKKYQWKLWKNIS